VKTHTVVDAVAIVAAIDRREVWHKKASQLFREIPKPFITCEAVITESCFLLGESAKAVESLMMLISSGVVRIEFSLENEVIAVQNLLKKYYNVPMSLADACLVRMSELFDAPVFTFDTDFRIYRRSRRNVIPLIGIDN
jgi:predicted nucleic acid-binding protein